MTRRYTRRAPLRPTTRSEVRTSRAITPPPHGRARRPRIEPTSPSSEDNATNQGAATANVPIVAAGPQLLATSGPPPTAEPTSSLAPFRGAMRALLTPVTLS